MTTSLLFLLTAIYFFLLTGFAFVSYREGEKRAARISLVVAALGSGFLIVGLFLPATFQLFFLLSISIAGVLSMALFLLPVGRADRLRDIPKKRFDERDIMFARAHLKLDSERYRAYYAMRPENKALDDLFRAQPGLLSPESRNANPLLFAAAKASFNLTDAMHAVVEAASAPKQVPLPENPARTAFIKSMAKYFGALDVGITELRPEHVYSNIGRGPGEWGAALEVDHPYAIAFTVEMDPEMMGVAPEAPVVMESARQYVEAGKVAVQLAITLRSWGYAARAHMDGNYRVICPLVARDAGLGEIGRMGLLMTPKLGPRVRIAVVTTNLDLIPDSDNPDGSTIDFCTICGKCADNCPPKAISFDDRVEIDGALRWKINSDVCFRYWTAIGTDCGRCMSICPYSHPDSFYHNLIRLGNQHSGLFRRAALRLDDLFYGKYPARREPPIWLRNLSS